MAQVFWTCGNFQPKTIKHGNLVTSFDIDTNSLFLECEPCIAAKQAHIPFPDHIKSRTMVPGELTYTDLWGPTST